MTGNQPPSLDGGSKSHLINITRHLYHCPHLGNFKGLTEVQLISNSMLISGIQHSEYFYRLYSIKTYHKIMAVGNSKGFRSSVPERG